MKRMSLLLSAAALVVALLGVTSLGYAAHGVVFFSKNTDRVDGLHASKRAQAGRLYPLGKNGKFPAFVLSVKQGPKGATGPVGPEGTPGPVGPVGPVGPSGGAALSRWAVVSSGGTLIRGSGVTNATAIGEILAVYHVTFADDVSECAYVASLDTSPGFASTAALGSDPRIVVVRTFDADGISSFLPFHLVLACRDG